MAFSPALRGFTTELRSHFLTLCHTLMQLSWRKCDMLATLGQLLPTLLNGLLDSIETSLSSVGAAVRDCEPFGRM